MPLNVADLNGVREEFDLTLPYAPDDPIHIVYNPQGFTPLLEQKINNLRTEDASAQALVQIIKSMLVDWDVVKMIDGSPVPYGVGDEALMELPIKFLGDVMGGIAAEIQSKAKAQGNS